MMSESPPIIDLNDVGEAKVLAVYDSPGPAELMTFDVIVTWKSGGQSVYRGVGFCNPVPTEYDVIGGPQTADVAIMPNIRQNEIRFSIPWLPVVTPCTPNRPALPIRQSPGPMPLPGTITSMAGSVGGPGIAVGGPIG